MKILIKFIQWRFIQPRCLVPCCEICMNAIYSYSFDHGNVDVPHHGTKGAHLCPTLKIKRAQDRQLLCDYFHIRWIHDKQWKNNCQDKESLFQYGTLTGLNQECFGQTLSFFCAELSANTLCIKIGMSSLALMIELYTFPRQLATSTSRERHCMWLYKCWTVVRFPALCYFPPGHKHDTNNRLTLLIISVRKQSCQTFRESVRYILRTLFLFISSYSFSLSI